MRRLHDDYLFYFLAGGQGELLIPICFLIFRSRCHPGGKVRSRIRRKQSVHCRTDASPAAWTQPDHVDFAHQSGDFMGEKMRRKHHPCSNFPNLFSQFFLWSWRWRKTSQGKRNLQHLNHLSKRITIVSCGLSNKQLLVNTRYKEETRKVERFQLWLWRRQLTTLGSISTFFFAL